MNAVLPQRTDGDGRSSVSLAELIALRARVAKLAVPVQESRAARSGQQSSRLHGRGMDYAESRIYQPGDDVRRLDWRLTARSGKLHTKLFQEEREGRLLIVVDHNPSMHFGTRVRFKSVQAARAAALAAWYGTRGGDRVGAMGFGGEDRLLRPQGGPRGALALCGALADWDARAAVSDRTEALSDALRRARRLVHGASRVLIVSDGWHGDAALRARLLDISRHAEVTVLIVADALESALAPSGRYPLEYEGRRIEAVLESERQRRDFKAKLVQGQERLAGLARALGLRCRAIDTVVDPLDAVAALLGPGRGARG
ncbi:MAG TPA: DUF58 domain-containing protein [Dyella sp.]|uniref:DUF58 domain-containing protein n=1 Tax=Dyella sp. TaxID=1869338 RepID=UPI002F958A17